LEFIVKKQRSSFENFLAQSLRGLIFIYRYSFSALLGRQCRFLPTCSDYANEAIRLHGAINGSVLVLRRLGRCHPWGGHGFDPVPELAFRDRKTDR
jgi:putative membrane protein insertion efficiency factor